MKNTMIAAIAAVFAFGVAWIPALHADESNQLSTITFSQPVEIPGQVLPAGTYVFKVLDFSDPDVVQIFNEDQSKIYATILALPDYRLKPTGKTVITFEERTVGSPDAIRAWFYPGMEYGHEFVYPKVRAVALAKASNTPVPSMPQNLEANTKIAAKSSQEPQVQAMKQAPIKAEQPSGAEVEVARAFTPPPQSPSQETVQVQQNTLPKTASQFPLIGLVSLILLCLGLSLRILRHRKPVQERG